MTLINYIQSPSHRANDEHHQEIAKWPAFDFRKLPLCQTSKKQLAGIYENVLKSEKVPSAKSILVRDFIVKNAYMPSSGVYVPIADDVYLKGKLPTLSEQLASNTSSFLLAPIPIQFFTNALLVPRGYGTSAFDADSLDSPTMRATNAGFLIVTVKSDCENREEFEQNLAWTRGTNDDFRLSAFARVDTKLCEFRDYRGYTIVFSDNRSLHFHFIFSTQHLLKCPWDADAASRGGEHQSIHSALMANAHRTYWDCVHEVFSQTLGPNLRPDTKLRSITQWRRTPWAIRTLEKGSDILDL